MSFQSLRTRLSLAYALFLLLVVGLGAFSIQQLNDYNRVTAEIRDRWLQSTRILGDLNNDTSDFRAAEGSYLLADTTPERQQSLLEMRELDASIIHTQVRYQRIRHDDREDQLYHSFLLLWNRYHGLVEHERELDPDQASALYRGEANRAYSAVSETLGHLTQWNLIGAKNAAERESRTYHEATGWIAGAILMAGFLLIVTIAFITRSISNPLLDLVQRMQRIANREKEVALPALQRHDEIGLMARAVAVFQENARDLLTTQQRLAEQAKTLELALQKEKEVTQQQHNFVLMTSHEFRTPLALIDGHAQRLYNARERLGPEDVGERAKKIRRAIQRLTRLLDGLVDMPQELPFHPQNVNMEELLHRLVQEYQELFPDHAFVVDISPLTHCWGDPELLHRALGNLLSNAIKYSSVMEPITIRAWADDGQWQIDIEDHGIGIPERDWPHLGERYFRGSNVGTLPGTGVGLFLVRQVLELHQASMRVTRVVPQGTLIRLNFTESSRLEKQQSGGQELQDFAITRQSALDDIVGQ